MIPRALRYELKRVTLLERLDHSEEPLVMLLGPSGFGKTAFMAQYARHCERRVAWHALILDDRDPAVFGGRFLEQLRRSFPEAPLPEQAPDILDARECARALNTLDDNVLVALDHVQDLHVDTLRWLTEFLLELHEGHRVVMTAFHRVALSLPLPYASEQILVLGGEQLRFTDAETQAYLARRGVAEPGAADTRGLVGWPAGVVLLAAGAQSALSAQDLVRDLLLRLPADLRTLLPQAAVLAPWSEQRARDAGLELPPGWLLALQRAGLPMTPLGLEEYAPLQVVMDVLQQELAQLTALAPALYLRAAQRAEQDGEPLLALQHYERGGLNVQARTLAERLCQDYLWKQDYHSVYSLLLSLKRWQRLDDAFEALYALALVRTNRLAEGEGLAARLLEHTEAPDALRALGHAALRRGDRTMQLHYAQRLAARAVTRAQRLDAARLEVAALLRLGRAREAVACAAPLLNSAEAMHPLEWAGAYFTLHTAHEHLGDWSESERYLRSALQIYESLNSHQQTAAALNALALIQGRNGDSGEAFQTVQRALNLAVSGTPDAHTVYLETWADLLLWNGQFSEAEAAYAQALAMARDHRIQPLVTRIQLGRAQALTQLGHYAQATDALDDAERSLPALDGLLPGQLLFQRGLVQFARGEPAQALALWDRVPPDQITDVQRVYAQACRPDGRPVPALPNFLRRAHQMTLATSAEPLLPQQGPPQKIVLDLRTCGPVQATLNGEPLHLPFQRAAELLAYLVVRGRASRADIIGDLWDGSNETRVVNYAKLTIRKLRAALQEHVEFNPLPFADNLYALSPLIEVRCDTHLVLSAAATDEPEALRGAFGAYRAQFLPDTEGEWAETVREQLHEAAMTAGLRLLRHSPFDEAMEVARLLLSLDPMREDIYLALLARHEDRGDAHAASQTYQSYARMLSREMNSVPPQALQQRYARRN